MLQVWAYKQDLKVELPIAEAAPDSGSAALKAIKKGMDLILRSKDYILTSEYSLGPETEYSVKDRTTHFWANLCSLKYLDAAKRRDNDFGWSWKRKMLFGWEFMDIIEGECLLHRRALRCDEDWLSLTDDVLVLVGRNFGSLISAAAGTRVCEAWNQIPCQKNYLTASVSCLRHLSEKRGTGDSCTRLANKTYWIPQGEPFRDCHECLINGANTRCHKKPQQLSQREPSDKNCPVPPLGGAVVFGKRSNKLWNPPCLGSKSQAPVEHNYSIPLAVEPENSPQKKSNNHSNHALNPRQSRSRNHVNSASSSQQSGRSDHTNATPNPQQISHNDRVNGAFNLAQGRSSNRTNDAFRSLRAGPRVPGPSPEAPNPKRWKI